MLRRDIRSQLHLAASILIFKGFSVARSPEHLGNPSAQMECPCPFARASNHRKAQAGRGDHVVGYAETVATMRISITEFSVTRPTRTEAIDSLNLATFVITAIRVMSGTNVIREWHG